MYSYNIYGYSRNNYVINIIYKYQQTYINWYCNNIINIIIGYSNTKENDT